MKTLFKALPLALFSPLAMAAASVSMQALVDLVVALIVIGLILGILLFLVNRAPFIPPEWKTGIVYVIYFVAAIIIINFLLGLAGYPLITLR